MFIGHSYTGRCPASIGIFFVVVDVSQGKLARYLYGAQKFASFLCTSFLHQEGGEPQRMV